MKEKDEYIEYLKRSLKDYEYEKKVLREQIKECNDKIKYIKVRISKGN